MGGPEGSLWRVPCLPNLCFGEMTRKRPVGSPVTWQLLCLLCLAPHGWGPARLWGEGMVSPLEQACSGEAQQEQEGSGMSPSLETGLDILLHEREAPGPRTSAVWRSGTKGHPGTDVCPKNLVFLTFPSSHGAHSWDKAARVSVPCRALWSQL